MVRLNSRLSPSSFSLFIAGALAVAAVASTGCKKDEKGAADAAPEAAVETVAAVDAAVAPVADAAVAALDAAVAPVVATGTARPVAKPKFVDPPICAAARNAKHQNRPTAAALEQRCVAAGGVM